MKTNWAPTSNTPPPPPAPAPPQLSQPQTLHHRPMGSCQIPTPLMGPTWCTLTRCPPQRWPRHLSPRKGSEEGPESMARRNRLWQPRRRRRRHLTPHPLRRKRTTMALPRLLILGLPRNLSSFLLVGCKWPFGFSMVWLWNLLSLLQIASISICVSNFWLHCLERFTLGCSGWVFWKYPICVWLGNFCF